MKQIIFISMWSEENRSQVYHKEKVESFLQKYKTIHSVQNVR